MIEKLKHIHHMFYVGLIFMAFPFASIIFGQIPWWHFFLALFFCAKTKNFVYCILILNSQYQ